MAYRRRLPHFQAGDCPVFLTWRLYGSLPPSRVFGSEASAGHAFVAMDSLLDRARSGPLHLRRPEVAGPMVRALLYGQDSMKYYQLHAWVVMANHVHVLLSPFVEVAKITHSLKRFTAREANRILGLIGQPFWQDESYDHLVRDGGEFDRIVRYIENNPVTAGLVSAPVDFPWSSAAHGS
ncbi:MAG TPA: transposase [Bryobacteraceae bacterium]|nr:transposase [Bryobacteraceae bacterium]